MPQNTFRSLPSVDRLLGALAGPRSSSAYATAAARATLESARDRVRRGEPAPELAELVEQIQVAIREMGEPPLRRVINATGVILQTNLGRAPLSERALAAVAREAAGYSNLEFDLESGGRGSRHDLLRALLRDVTNAEDAIVVNNNAAALLMVLQVFASDREVIVSRGQAVEIGGGFRIPDVLRQSGARLVEVGTTNRTYVRDYEAAITTETAAVLRVHTSNFKVVGFTAEAQLEELAGLARERGILAIDDLGSGCLLDTEPFGIAHEPTVQESLAAGMDLALFSGDKLLGGPQCGIIAGQAELIAKLRTHPLARALRVDKLTIVALAATLQSYREGRATAEIPVWRMVTAPLPALKRRAARWARLGEGHGTLVASRSMVGGGSLPGEGLDTWCAGFSGPGLEEVSHKLRTGKPGIIGRIENGLLLLDVRTVDPRDDAAVNGRLVEVFRMHEDAATTAARE